MTDTTMMPPPIEAVLNWAGWLKDRVNMQALRRARRWSDAAVRLAQSDAQWYAWRRLTDAIFACEQCYKRGHIDGVYDGTLRTLNSAIHWGAP